MATEDLVGVTIGSCGHHSSGFRLKPPRGNISELTLTDQSTTTDFGNSAIEAFYIATEMITTSTKTAPVMLKPVQDDAMKVDGTDAKYGDWRDDLARDGYAVIKGAIPRERADKYADKMYSWLEGL
jgi:hypothetical protein